jgi:DNA helicase MCM8
MGNARTAANADAHFSDAELHAIREIQSEPELFKLVVNSLSPGIFGHELVKAGLALTLFGGTARRPHAGGTGTRSDPHMLVVGDPGLGKSQMLNYLSSVAPRGVYVCGSSTTSTGLTVTVVRDPVSGEFALEAGALVLADRGVCCIDEFDKMTVVQHQALLEAMEQQCISVAKAGIVCSLPARGSVIAAANPVGGHYNRAKTVAENLKMSAPILSRFDLIFILLDAADREKDRLLTRHVFGMHGARRDRSAHAAPPDDTRARWASQAGHEDWHASRSLSARLCVTESEFDPLPPKLLRKYIEYARAYVHPRLTPPARALLKQFYLQLRARHRGSECGAITTRQLESLKRLAEARAKLELLEVVTAQHVQDVIDIMKESLFYDHMADLGAQIAQGGDGFSSAAIPDVDFNFRPAGATQRNAESVTGLSRAKLRGRVLEVLNRFAAAKGSALLQRHEIKQAYMELPGAEESRLDDVVEDLNGATVLLKKGNGLYSLRTSAHDLDGR